MQPLLRINFHQEAPYNGSCEYANCKSTTNGRVLAGCGPVAYAQVLLYYNTQTTRNKAPNLQKLRDYHYSKTNATYAKPSYGDAELDWAAAELTYNIFSEYFLATTGIYSGCAATFIPDLVGDETIESGWGFVNGEYRSYNYNDVKNSIIAGKPLITKGFRMKLAFPDFITDFTTGYIWIIDGIQARRVRYTILIEADYDECGDINIRDRYRNTTREEQSSGVEITGNEIHNNWGWNESGWDPPNGKDGSLQAYQAGEWSREGTFRVSNGKTYAIDVDIIAYITPR